MCCNALQLLALFYHWLDLSNELHRLCEIPAVPKIQAVKIGSTQRKSVLVRTSLLKRILFTYFQLWWLVFLEPPGVQRHVVPHFNGLISADWNLKSSRVWQHFYILSNLLKKAILEGKRAKLPRMILSSCSYKSKQSSIMNVECCQF